MTNILERLRDISYDISSAEIIEAADEIQRLREALKPFTLETRPEHNVYGYEMVFVKPEQLRAAKAALGDK